MVGFQRWLWAVCTTAPLICRSRAETNTVVVDIDEGAADVCSNFRNSDLVPNEYYTELLQAAQYCTGSGSHDDPKNRFAFYDCVLTAMRASTLTDDWNPCMSFLEPFWENAERTGGEIDATAEVTSSTSVGEAVLSQTSELYTTADADTQVVIKVLKHMLRNVTCAPLVPASTPLEHTTWTHVPDRTFSKMKTPHGLVGHACVCT